jgi:hypothetical protein
MVYRLSIA